MLNGITLNQIDIKKKQLTQIDVEIKKFIDEKIAIIDDMLEQLQNDRQRLDLEIRELEETKANYIRNTKLRKIQHFTPTSQTRARISQDEFVNLLALSLRQVPNPFTKANLAEIVMDGWPGKKPSERSLDFKLTKELRTLEKNETLNVDRTQRVHFYHKRSEPKNVANKMNFENKLIKNNDE